MGASLYESRSMMADVNKLVRVISEEIARELIKERGAKVSDTIIASRVGEAFEELNKLDVDDFLKVIKGYVDVAEVHVSISTWRVADDGRIKTDQELEEEMKF